LLLEKYVAAPRFGGQQLSSQALGLGSTLKNLQSRRI